MKILFAGGGTGGHIFPIIAIAREIKNSSPDADLYFIGPRDEESKHLLEKEGIKVKNIFTGKMRRYSGGIVFIQNLVDLAFKIPLGIIQSFFYIFFLSPDLIFSKGGHGALPAIISAKILQTPLFIHESDINPGLVNKRFSSYALEIFTSFPETKDLPIEKMILVGNPIRKSIIEKVEEEEIKKELGINKTKPTILFLGGSQGSERINDLALSIMPQILPEFQVIHQCGIKNSKEIIIQTEFLISKELKKNYHLIPFLTENQLRSAYQAADLIVSRAGSGSIFEIAAAGKPSILIPLSESAQNHQLENAYFYSETGAAIVIEEENVTNHLFTKEISNLLKSNKRLNEMAQSAKNFSRPRSAEIIAEYIIEFLD